MKFIRRSGAVLAPLTFLWLSFFGSKAAEAQQSSHNMLWRVQSDSTVLYLLGSVHLLPKSMYPLPAPIERAFDSAERVVFELNLDSVTQLGASMSIVEMGMYTDGRTLKGAISKSTYAQLRKRLKKLGYEISMFDRFKPWLAAFMLMAGGAQDGGFEAQYGIDMYFHGKAKEAGKPQAGLETLEDQIGIFANLDEATQEKFLQQMLDAKHGDDELDVIMKAWKSGDAGPLIKLLDQYTKTDAVLYDGLLFRRNDRWVPEIEKMLKTPKRTMVIVGTLHLVGDRGVVAQLRARGYTVEQL